MKLTTYKQWYGNHEAIFCSWADAEEILGHPHNGTADDETEILSVAARRFPNIQWLNEADGSTDEYGLYYFNPEPKEDSDAR